MNTFKYKYLYIEQLANITGSYFKIRINVLYTLVKFYPINSKEL